MWSHYIQHRPHTGQRWARPRATRRALTPMRRPPMPRVHRTLPAGSRSSTATPSDPVCAHPARAQRRGPALRALLRACNESQRGKRSQERPKTDRTRHRLRDETLGVSAHDASRADLCCAPTAGKTDTEAAQAGGGVGGLMPGTLPPGWEEKFSSSRQRVYYYQKKTGTSTWEHPNPLPRRKPNKTPDPGKTGACGFAPFACWEMASNITTQNAPAEPSRPERPPTVLAAQPERDTTAHSMQSSRATSASNAPTPQLSPRTTMRMRELANRGEGSKMSQGIGTGNVSPDLTTDEGIPLFPPFFPLAVDLCWEGAQRHQAFAVVVVCGVVCTSSVVKCDSVVLLRKSCTCSRTDAVLCCCVCRVCCLCRREPLCFLNWGRSALLFQLRCESVLQPEFLPQMRRRASHGDG